MRALVVVAIAGCASPARVAVPESAVTPDLVRLDAAPVDAFVAAIELSVRNCRILERSGGWYPEIHLPTGRPIRLLIHSDDLERELAFELAGATVQVPPGERRELAIRIARPGTYPWRCPTGAATAQLIAEAPADYEAGETRRLEESRPSTQAGLIALGKRLYEKSCSKCHTTDGTPSVGVSFRGIWGTTVATQRGEPKVVDRGFVRAATMTPRGDYARQGFPDTMPFFDGAFTTDELDALAAFVESLK